MPVTSVFLAFFTLEAGVGHYPSQHFLERRRGNHNLISLPTRCAIDAICARRARQIFINWLREIEKNSKNLKIINLDKIETSSYHQVSAE